MYKTPVEPCLKSSGFWLLALVAAFPQTVNAGITSINITRVESPTFEGRSFGSVGQYEKLVGTIHGEVDPADRRNAGITSTSRALRRTPRATSSTMSTCTSSSRSIQPAAAITSTTT